MRDTERNDLDDKIKNKKRVFVLFYATWCPFCKKFLPIFEECVKKYPNEYIKVSIDDGDDLCKKYSIEYYPTVIMFKNGKVHKRLDAEPGVGLNKKQLEDFTKK